MPQSVVPTPDESPIPQRPGPALGKPGSDRPSDDWSSNEKDADGNSLSGHVVIQLAADIDPGREPDLRDLARRLELSALLLLLDELGVRTTSRVVTSIDPYELLAREQRVADEWRPEHSLARAWRVDVSAAGVPALALVRRFTELRDVETAHAEVLVTDPVIGAAPAAALVVPLSPTQGYLDAAPIGIDARWASTQPGGRGEGIAVVDVEQGWVLNHRAFEHLAPVCFHLVNRSAVGDHGAAVLAVLAADKNAAGLIGVAPGIRSLSVASHYDGQPLHVADAIHAALSRLVAGDVLVLEVQRGDLRPLPTESDPWDRTAIRTAVGQGIVVVEAAGNGSHDLDAWKAPDGTTPLAGRPVGGPGDSGAVLVGAAESGLVGATHARYPSSNYGKRVHCYAWGENIVTAGDGDLTPKAVPRAKYTGRFRQTSGATAIVAGVAAVVQGMQMAAHGVPLPAPEVREILADPANGTAQAVEPELIGVMPNLRRIGARAFGL